SECPNPAEWALSCCRRSGHRRPRRTRSGRRCSVPSRSENPHVFGHPAGFLLSQAFGGISDAKVGGAPLGTPNGASNTTLAAAFWPYANVEQKQYLVIVGYLMPPNGSYNKDSAINFATAYQPLG